MDLIDILRAFHPQAAEYTFFSIAHEIFSRIDCMSGNKINPSKCEKTEITSSISPTTVVLNKKSIIRKKHEKYKNTWRLNNMLPNNE